MQYLISVIDDGQAQAAQRTESASRAEMAAVDEFNEQLRAAGHWVLAGGLAAPATATVVDNRGGTAVFTDGPFVESTEYLTGFWIMEATDLDEVRSLAARASKACNRKLEVRALLSEPA